MRYGGNNEGSDGAVHPLTPNKQITKARAMTDASVEMNLEIAPALQTRAQHGVGETDN